MPIPIITIHNYNFGDALSLPLVKFLTGQQTVHYEQCGCETRRLSGIGSVAFLWTGFTDVWGSGVLDERRSCEPGLPDMEFHSVRGPMTRAHLLKKGYSDIPEVYGDPGILAPAMYSPILAKEKIYDVGIICHHGDDVRRISGSFVRNKGTSYVFISPYEPCDKVMRKISQCRRVCSSSLHGIVIAEAMGIPCSWFRATDINDPFKFYDYFLGSGRNEDGCKVADIRYSTRVDFDSMSVLPRPYFDIDGLLGSFPADIGICHGALISIEDYFNEHTEIKTNRSAK